LRPLTRLLERTIAFASGIKLDHQGAEQNRRDYDRSREYG
jgi:hypothetical protein